MVPGAARSGWSAATALRCCQTRTATTCSSRAATCRATSHVRTSAGRSPASCRSSASSGRSSTTCWAARLRSARQQTARPRSLRSAGCASSPVSADMRASVIVPTYDHGPLIGYAVGSALAQTESDLEVLIVGDGVPDSARPAIERVVASDPRVRFLDRPKGAGHGLRARDEAIREAGSDTILYLSDDDLWLPEHVELMCGALEQSEFAASL